MEKVENSVIFSKLSTLRREIADNAGVVPRGIISDVAIRKIVEFMRTSEEDLNKISGISQLFMQKFAKLFLAELERIKQNPKEIKVSKVASDALKLFNQGFSFEDIKKRLFANNMSMAANYIVELIEAPYPIDRKMFIPDATYKKVLAFVKKNPEVGLRDAQSKINMEIDQYTLKIAYSFAKVELGLIK